MPLLLVLYWLSLLEAISAKGNLSRDGKYAVEIVSPAPRIAKADSKLTEVQACDYFYQALLNENVTFTVVVNQTLPISVSVSTTTSSLEETICSVIHCITSAVCTLSYSTEEQLTRHITVQTFLVAASPYNQALGGDAEQIVCVQVNETRSLTFLSYPGPQQSTRNGSATFFYAVDGYPLPFAYALVCDGEVLQNNTQGVFQLTNLSSGKRNCFATARSRIASTKSKVTQLTVEIAPEVIPHASFESVERPVREDQEQLDMIGTIAGSVGAAIILLVLSTVIVRKVVCRQPKEPPSVVNIHNDNSQHTVYIHNGPKVESYGPNSTIVVPVVDAETARLLKSGDDVAHSALRDMFSYSDASECSEYSPERVTYTLVDGTLVDGSDVSLRDSREL